MVEEKKGSRRKLTHYPKRKKERKVGFEPKKKKKNGEKRPNSKAIRTEHS